MKTLIAFICQCFCFVQFYPIHERRIFLSLEFQKSNIHHDQLACRRFFSFKKVKKPQRSNLIYMLFEVKTFTTRGMKEWQGDVTEFKM